MVLMAPLVTSSAAWAFLDIDDQGPVLSAGGFALRITNAGIIGNAFLDKGLSFDPSFEIRPGTGYEALNHAELWVGATSPSVSTRVTGGPLLEWRPTLDPEDRVRAVDHGRPGVRRLVDDDGDGAVDEEALNNRDDDGDGEVDEDLGLFSQQMMSADYVDDRPEAIYGVYEGGESHRPLGLSVHQEAYAWGAPGYEGIAGLSFRITNHGNETLRDVRLGFLADLDSRTRNDRGGHINDRVEYHGYVRSMIEATDSITIGGVVNCEFPPPCPLLPCVTTLQQQVPVVMDDFDTRLPAVAVLPLRHTTDPLALLSEAQQYARAPSAVSFQSYVFSRSRIPGQGGMPATDHDRFQAMAGAYPEATTDIADDYVVLVACGPFRSLAPGQSLEFELALVATLDRDSIDAALANAAVLHYGRILNLLPDSTSSRFPKDWNYGDTGINGHEVCIEAPIGFTFMHDPHCPAKFPVDGRPDEVPELYTPGRCIWTDADCQRCSGLLGLDTRLYWSDPGDLPAEPPSRLVSGDHRIRIEWSNRPEILHRAGISGESGTRFAGYRVYKLLDWRHRESLLPPDANWALLGAYGNDVRNSEIPLATITDTTLDYERILFEQKLFPMGRYAIVDSQVLNGFDYAYVVTTVLLKDRAGSGGYVADRIESPFTPSFAKIVQPHAAAKPRAGDVWVVPNPFRAKEVWQRPPVLGDQLTRHLDFMGLPRARSTIKIWTVAGDLVTTLDHDGTNGDGEAAWNLVSRNGQEVESGIYLFTVDSPLGQQVGKFVVIR